MKKWNIILLAAVACVATHSSAQQLILDGQAIDLQPGSQVIIEEDGDVVVTSAAGDLTCSNVTSPPTVSLTAMPTVLSGPGSVTLSWTTQFADTCTATNGGSTSWSGTNITLPTGQTTITGLTQTTSFTLSCDNTLGTTTDSATVTVSTSDEYAGFPPPSDCPSTAPPPAGTGHENPLEVVSGQTGRLVVTNNFSGPFGSGWPGISNSKEDIYISSGNWVALGFNAESSCTGGGCTRTNGIIEWESSILPDGPKVVSISRCPGDFSTSLGLCRSNFLNLRWTYSSGAGCVLTPGEPYYLNIIHGQNGDPSITTCGVGECGAFLTVR